MFIFSLYMMFRNEKVFKARIGLLRKDHESYRKLDSYNSMLYKFWIPIDRFIEEAKRKGG